MSEKEQVWVFVIGAVIFMALMYLIHPWSLVSVPITLIGILFFEDRNSMIKENKELKIKLEETKDHLDSSKSELAKSNSNNRELRYKIQELENEVEQLKKDPTEEIRQLELNAEKEILGNA